MGDAGRHHAPPYAPPPLPQPMPAAREVTITPGGTATATWDFGGGRGIKIGIRNVGSAPCAFEGHVLRPGKTAVIDVRDGTRAFMLAITSAQGTRIKLLAAWHPAPPPRRTRGVLKEIVRDEKTKLITGIVTSQVWVDEASA